MIYQFYIFWGKDWTFFQADWAEDGSNIKTHFNLIDLFSYKRIVLDAIQKNDEFSEASSVCVKKT